MPTTTRSARRSGSTRSGISCAMKRANVGASATAYGTLVLSERTIAMHRLVIRESDQFPEVATAFYEAAIRRANDAVARWLRRQCERGLITLEDPQAAAGMLRGMMSTDPRRAGV